MVPRHCTRWLLCPYTVKLFFSRRKKALRLNLGIQHLGHKVYKVCSNDDTRMTLDLLTVWSNVCPSCCDNTGRSCMVFADMQYLFLSVERIVAHGLLVFLPHSNSSRRRFDMTKINLLKLQLKQTNNKSFISW